MKKSFFKNAEWIVLICSLLLLAIGLVGLYSATKNAELEAFMKQIKWFLISIPFLLLFTFVDYKHISKFSPVLYILVLAMLVGVLFTTPINGASSWYTIGDASFQPSELAKIFVIIFISYMISLFQLKGKSEINKIHKLFVILLLAAIPMGLIIIQPDVGTSISYIALMLFILFTAGIGKRYMIPAVILIVVLAVVMYKIILPQYLPYALRRIEVFLNPGIDPRGDGYNIIQSKLAVGSGYIFGMGFGKGNQTQLGYLYPKTTDFIFALISEELGFVASISIVITYIILIVKAIQISKTAKDNLGAYISIGIAGLFFYHMLQNISMTIGLLPITGIPLPFVSYGGSSLITNFIAIGLLLNISGRRQKAIFTNEVY